MVDRSEKTENSTLLHFKFFLSLDITKFLYNYEEPSLHSQTDLFTSAMFYFVALHKNINALDVIKKLELC